MKKAGIALGENFRLTKDGKLVKVQKARSVSEIIRQKSSKRVRPARCGT